MMTAIAIFICLTAFLVWWNHALHTTYKQTTNQQLARTMRGMTDDEINKIISRVLDKQEVER